jgi:hypothetical protein
VTGWVVWAIIGGMALVAVAGRVYLATSGYYRRLEERGKKEGSSGTADVAPKS